MSIVSKKIIINTILGELLVGVQIAADHLPENSVTISHFAISPELQGGMSVLRCRVVLLTVKHSGPIQLLRFSATLNCASRIPCSGTPSTGQGLEAQEWRNDRAVLIVGTEDSEELHRRYPTHEFPPAVADYASDSITLRIADVAQMVNPSLHFVVAENYLPEPVEDSAWFAADWSHEKLLSEAASLSGQANR